MSEQILTQERLKQILFYSIVTGQFFWKTPIKAGIKINSIAGVTMSNGYIYIGINKKKQLARRLAWFWVTGEWPSEEIDHKDRVRNNNAWLNLREANRSQNALNRGLQSNNKSGYIGVSWYKKSQKWRARVFDYGEIVLGYFNTAEDAHNARMDYYCNHPRNDQAPSR